MTDAYERAKADDEQWEREHDSREKLERDIRFGSTMTMYSNSDETEVTAKWSDVLGWLDRQAAITRRETRQNWQDAPNVLDRTNLQTIAELQGKVDELQAEMKVDAIALEELRRQRDELQAELDAYDQTHMLLPLDADGVPIHVDDVLESDEYGGKRFTCCGLSIDTRGGEYWAVAMEHDKYAGVVEYTTARRCHHVEPKRTIEEVLADVVTLCANTWKDGESPFAFYGVSDVMESGNIKGYADELRGMGVCDE